MKLEFGGALLFKVLGLKWFNYGTFNIYTSKILLRLSINLVALNGFLANES
jgi:hypothetical protein